MESRTTSFKYRSFVFVTILFLVIGIWRLVLAYIPSNGSDINVQIWAASYQIIAWVGAIVGLIFAKSWGGRKSVIGRAALAFAFGLLLQSFGQCVFSYYFYTGLEAPYPSLADLGFFGSIPFYIYGICMLAKASGAHVSMKAWSNKMIAFIIPLAVLALSYIEFLREYEFDFSHPIRIFLDFGYPLGQAVYLSIAVLAYFLSRKMLGGIMRRVIMFFIIALVAQYIADYIFLYQSSRGTFVGGGTSDFVYFIAYFVMAVSLIKLRVTFDAIKNTD